MSPGTYQPNKEASPCLGDFLFRETLRALEGALGDRLLHRETLAAGELPAGRGKIHIPFTEN